MNFTQTSLRRVARSGKAQPPTRRSATRLRIAGTFLGLAALLTMSASALAAPFTAGDIVVTRVGTGTTLSSAATAVFLDEYTTGGALVQSIALPTVATTSGNRALTLSGTANSEGFLTLSGNGQYLTLGGFNATAVTTSAVAGTTSTSVNRVAGRIDTNGNVDTTTSLSDAYNTSDIRSVYTADGTAFTLAGNGTALNSVATGGSRTAALGATTSTAISTTPANLRVANVFGGQLYASSASGSNVGVNIVSGSTTTLIAPTGTGSSPYDFVISSNGLTLYVADDRTNGSGGLLQYTRADTTSNFTLANTFNTGIGTGVGLRGLSASADLSTLYATTSENSANRIVSFGTATSTFTTLATAAANTSFRGVDFAPQVAAVPEPGLTVAMGMGLFLFGTARLRRRKPTA